MARMCDRCGGPIGPTAFHNCPEAEKAAKALRDAVGKLGRCTTCDYPLDSGGQCWRCEPRKGPIPSGIDLAAITNPEHAHAIRLMKEQLLIVFLKRLGGRVDIPVAELDDTQLDNMGMKLDLTTKTYYFQIVRSPRG